jgi:Holliday junction resolvase RusA-like endonuclease
MIQTYRLEGVIVPAVRMTQASRFTDRAQVYLTNRGIIQMQIRLQMMEKRYEKFHDKTSLYIHVDYWPPKGKRQQGDVDNILKSVKDAMAGLLFKNDVWFDDDRITRHSCNGEGMASIEIGTFDDWWKREKQS